MKYLLPLTGRRSRLRGMTPVERAQAIATHYRSMHKVAEDIHGLLDLLDQDIGSADVTTTCIEANLNIIRHRCQQDLGITLP